MATGLILTAPAFRGATVPARRRAWGKRYVRRRAGRIQGLVLVLALLSSLLVTSLLALR